MNPEHAIDIYSNFVTGKITFIRRRDSSEYIMSEAINAKKIGHAAFEGIAPKISNKLPWVKIDDNWCIEWDYLDVAVAWRDSESMIIATPICDWGKAPDIKIDKEPTYTELGNAIIKQLEYAKIQREKNT